ncbi:MAG: hypothetical protein HY984_01245 [Candidatus Magasanikbacteria bacterium]|nr:hypothetical protein [Candidatus Magasanikbacteria bacterium]
MKKTDKFLLSILGGLLLFVLGGVASFFILRAPATRERATEPITLPPAPAALPTPENGQSPTSATNTPVTGTDLFGPYLEFRDPNSGKTVKQYNLAAGERLAIGWRQGATALDAVKQRALITAVDPGWYDAVTSSEKRQMPCVETENDTFCDPYIYEAGTLTAPKRLSGRTVYHVFTPYIGMATGYNQALAIYELALKKFIFLGGAANQGEGSLSPIPPEDEGWFVGYIPGEFPELTAPQIIKIPGQKSYLIFSSAYQIGPSPFSPLDAPYNRGGVVDVPHAQTAKKFTAAEQRFVDPRAGPVYFRDGGYQIVLPDGSVQRYELLPYFFRPLTPEPAEKELFPAAYIPEITWNMETDSKKVAERYELGGDINTGGCASGIKPLTNIVDGKKWFDDRNLLSVGKTTTGESVYEMKDAATNPYYKALFDYGYQGSRLIGVDGDKYDATVKKLDYISAADKFADFLRDRPIFFWRDHENHWRVYKKAKYTSLAECGKPVIYLYPEKSLDVRVEIKPSGGLTKTEPEYGADGWRVRATPASALFNYADGKIYPYLFWEGRSGGPERPAAGFVWKREEVSVKLSETLARAGLNPREIGDFLEFWQAKLTVKPYVFVTFFPQRQFDLMAPLTITPRPQIVIRVFMDYEPLDAPREVEPLSLKSPVRRGFTVVEWGGVLHK